MPDSGGSVYNFEMPGQPTTRPASDNVTDQVYLRLLQCDRTAIDRSWRSTGNRDSFWRLYVNNRDGASIRVGGQWHPLTADAVHLVPAWVRFDCRCRRRVDHLYVHFDPVGLPGSITRELFTGPIALPRDEAVDELAARCALAGDGGVSAMLAGTCAAKALAFTAMARLAVRLTADQRRRLVQLPQADRAIGPALRRIDGHYDQPLRVAALAELCCMSGDHFIRRFREAVGQTPGQYLAERRVAAAAERLLLTDESIEQIAERCGFPNRFHFSRVFARHMGTPPATYRKSQLV